jgi:choline dehydrogenase
MLSGIGDSGTLTKFGIEVIADRCEVGRNLQDHVDVSLKQRSVKPVTMTPVLSLRRKVPAFFDWALFRKGPGVTNHFEVAGYVRSHAGVDRPDVQLCFIPLLVHYDGSAVASGHGFQVTVMALRPKSRGAVTLTSPAPGVAPSILFNYLQDTNDILPLREGLLRLRDILSQPAFDDLRGEELTPGGSRVAAQDLDAFIRETGKSTHHPCGTCRMGADADSVVDGEGRVRGVGGLRVVDASIMPTITSGNINAPIYMMAEKISDAMRGRPALAPES